MLRLRGARKSDFGAIDRLYKKLDFTLDTRHLERLVVVEDDEDGSIIAVGALTTSLEAAFVADDSTHNRLERARALDRLMKSVEHEVKIVGYDNFHVHATNENIQPVLERHYGFKPSKGNLLVKWVE